MRLQNEHQGTRKIRIALIICTYRRRAALRENLCRILDCDFYKKDNELYDRLHIFVVDNASELTEEEICNKHGVIRLFHNPNTGGSGGFARGMCEVRSASCKGEYYSNVVLMDDDAMLHPESLYRLYAFLCFEKSAYTASVIAGRMFCLNERNVQYTAAEIWNRGNLRHVGFLNDMTQSANLDKVNDSTLSESDIAKEDSTVKEGQPAEYSGWWFACFPYEYVEKNDPLPFFLHCDDVEYGMRHGGVPIILNGIQVWHETADARQSAVIRYYDRLNPLIVNDIYHLTYDSNKVIDEWLGYIGYAHSRGDWEEEYIGIVAFRDYLRWKKCGFPADTAKQHAMVTKKLRHNRSRLSNAISWRMVRMLAGLVL